MKVLPRLSVTNFFRLGIGVAATFWTLSGHAASLTFYAPATIGDTSALDAPLYLGDFSSLALAQAGNFGSGAGIGGAQTVVTLGGQTINFAAASFGSGAPAGTDTALYYAGREDSANLFTGNTGDTGFNSVLQSQGWANSFAAGTPTTLRLGNLVAGQTYIVELLASDMRGASAGRTQYFGDTQGGGNTSETFSTATATYVMAFFTADENGYQDIYVYPGATTSSPNDTTIAGFTLYSATPIPEPGVVTLLALAAACGFVFSISAGARQRLAGR